MSTKYVYTIFDRVANETGPLIMYNNDEQAMRSYPQAFKGMEHVRVSDFMLCCIGIVDTNTMRIEGYDIPKDITPKMEV